MDTFADTRRLSVGAGRLFADADDGFAAPPIAAHTSHDGVAHATGGSAAAEGDLGALGQYSGKEGYLEPSAASPILSVSGGRLPRALHFDISAMSERALALGVSSGFITQIAEREQRRPEPGA